MTQYSRGLEKTKTRLQAELEDLQVHNDRERMDERAVEKQVRKLEEQVERSNKRLQQEERMRQVAEQEAARLKTELARLRAQPSPTLVSSSIERSKSAFENIPPPNTEIGTVNGVPASRRYENIMSDLQKRDIYSKDGVKDEALRGRILRELNDANKELEAGMRATLSGIGNPQRNLGRR
jgi:myosin protein heavy chain